MSLREEVDELYDEIDNLKETISTMSDDFKNFGRSFVSYGQEINKLNQSYGAQATGLVATAICIANLMRKSGIPHQNIIDSISEGIEFIKDADFNGEGERVIRTAISTLNALEAEDRARRP